MITILKLVLLVILLPVANAGSGIVAVIDGEGPVCEQQSPEHLVIRLTSEELITALKNYLANRRQDLVFTTRHVQRQPGEWETADAQWIERAFTGGTIKFCGEPERQKYFRAIVEELKKPDPDLRVFVLCLFHCKQKGLSQLVNEEIRSKSLDPVSKKNLERAKRHIEQQRKKPEPYPTPAVVRRIEKEWAKNIR